MYCNHKQYRLDLERSDGFTQPLKNKDKIFSEQLQTDERY